MIRTAIQKVTGKKDLSYEEAYDVMDEIMGGKCSDIQISAYLVGLLMKGETIDEIVASAEAMRSHAERILHDMDVLEIVGTGGDGSGTFNISTTSSIVIAAGGVKVAKHGNRAASSRSGSADVLEALGVDIAVSPEKSLELLKNIGICFLFAQNYHKAMKYASPVRKELGIRTIFNILGPLSNPAGANMELMGVYDRSLVEPLAAVMARLGVKKGIVVYGEDGLDEISASAPTFACEIIEGGTRTFEMEPEDFGIRRCPKAELTGGSPEENAEITRNILSGKEKGGKLNAVLLNSGASFYIAGVSDSIKDGVDYARETINSGKAYDKLQEFIRESHK